MTNFFARRMERRAQRFRALRAQHMPQRYPIRKNWTVLQLTSEVNNLAREVSTYGPQRPSGAAYASALIAEIRGLAAKLSARVDATAHVDAADVAKWLELRKVGIEVCAGARRDA